VSGPLVDPPLVEIDRLTIRPHGEAILDAVTINVACGSAHVVVGRNGAGKSTLIRAVLGQIAFDGRIVMHWRRNGSIGYVPQSFPIDPTLPVTVQDFLALTRQRRPVSLGIARATRARIEALLATVGMSGTERRPLAVLSGGELRRVLLAHALDPEPELLILDEPGSGLDDVSARWLEDTLVAMRDARTTTILMVSHDHDRVRRIADRVTVLDRHVVADGHPDELFDRDGLAGAARGAAWRGDGR
jgi:zinc transport system ATP-binding protein